MYSFGKKILRGVFYALCGIAIVIVGILTIWALLGGSQ